MNRMVGVVIVFVLTVAFGCAEAGTNPNQDSLAMSGTGGGVAGFGETAGIGEQPASTGGIGGIANTGGATNTGGSISTGGMILSGGTGGGIPQTDSSVPDSGFPPTGGSGGIGGSGGLSGSGGIGGSDDVDGGIHGLEVTGGTGGTAPVAEPCSGGIPLDGDCCEDRNCICRDEPPALFAGQGGPYRTASVPILTGTLFYPTTGDPPFAAIAITPGFLNSGPEMNGWGTFYASWGFVTVVTAQIAIDFPPGRGANMLNSIEEIKAMNEDSSSPLFGMLAGRFGTSGYSMGGGGTTIASVTDPTLCSSVGLAAWGDVQGMTVPTLFLCGNADTVAGCSPPFVATGTPSMLVTISGYTHFNWFGPTQISGYYALAWQKVYLEGDERWKSLIPEQILGVAAIDPHL